MLQVQVIAVHPAVAAPARARNEPRRHDQPQAISPSGSSSGHTYPREPLPVNQIPDLVHRPRLASLAQPTNHRRAQLHTHSDPQVEARTPRMSTNRLPIVDQLQHHE